MMGIERLRARTRQLKTELYALYLAYRDPRVPWYARVIVACVVGYAFSPIDLIPDAIPLLGYLDDLIVIPLGIMLARKLIPPTVLAECRAKARHTAHTGRPAHWIAASLMIVLWLLVISSAVVWLARLVYR